MADQRRRPEAIVVTSASQSRAEERDARKRRYLLTMVPRILLIGVAVAFLRPWPWALYPSMILATVLPYFAVVVANSSNRKAGRVDPFDRRDEPAAIGSGRATDPTEPRQ